VLKHVTKQLLANFRARIFKFNQMSVKMFTIPFMLANSNNHNYKNVRTVVERVCVCGCVLYKRFTVFFLPT